MKLFDKNNQQLFASLKCNIRHNMVLDSTVEISATKVNSTHVHAEYLLKMSTTYEHTYVLIYFYLTDIKQGTMLQHAMYFHENTF